MAKEKPLIHPYIPNSVPAIKAAVVGSMMFPQSVMTSLAAPKC